MSDKPRFLVSFDCESEYEFKGRKYRVRVGAHRSITRADYFPKVEACIGTVMHNYDNFHEFPSKEAIEALSEVSMGVNLVGAKWTEDFSEVLYDGAKPETIEDRGTVWSKPYRERWDKWWNERNVA